MDERVLDSMVELVMLQLATFFEGSMLPGDAQIVVRPIYTWPGGKPAVWVMINWPN